MGGAPTLLIFIVSTVVFEERIDVSLLRIMPRNTWNSLMLVFINMEEEHPLEVTEAHCWSEHVATSEVKI